MTKAPTTTRGVLIAARKLISDPKRWNQEYFALRANGGHTQSCNPEAVSWCMDGALNKICGPDGNLKETARAVLVEVTGPIVPFNDSSPHEDVLAAFDIAICLES